MDDPRLELVPVDSIIIDTTILPRCEIDGPIVQEYKQVYQLGVDEMPRIVCFKSGESYWLADGCRRMAAQISLDLAEIPCVVHAGGKSEARWYAAKANLAHGERLTLQQRLRATELLLLDERLADRPDQVIAGQSGVDRKTVAKMRDKMVKSGRCEETETAVVNQVQSGKPVTQSRPRRYKKKTDTTPSSTSSVLREPREPTAEVPPSGHKDQLGEEIPEFLSAVASDMTRLTALQTSLGGIIETATKLHGLESGAGVELDLRYIESSLAEVRRHIGASTLHAVCPNCRSANRIRKTCEVCGGKGWLTREGYGLMTK